MSLLSIAKLAKAAPFIQLRTESPAAPEAELPMQVIRRNGTVSKFDAGKISVAMTKALSRGRGAHARRPRAACMRSSSN